MSTVTYSQQEILDKMEEWFVPLKIESKQNPDLAQLYQIIATPTFLVLDPNRKVIHRSSGFLPPFEFTQLLRLMRATYEMNRRDYDQAISLLSSITQEALHLPLAAEALYVLGSAKYKKSGDFSDAVVEWRKIKLHFPGSPWFKKVEYAV